jgi:preprotein translocase subunit SecG
MEIIRTLLIILEALCSLALIGLILLQKSKSEGLGLAFGGGGNDTLFGARGGNVLTKATIVIGCVFLANTLLLGILFAGSANESIMDDASLVVPAPLEQPVAPIAPVAPVAPVIPAE